MARPRVFIPGGGGKIGRLLQREWSSQEDFEPVFLERSDWDILMGKAPQLKGSDLVLDLAGTVRGDVLQNPKLAARIAKWAAEAGAVHFYMSSASVYPGGPEPMLETGQLAPSSAYGQSKVDGEIAASSAFPKTVILRLGNVAGLDALLGGLRKSQRAVLDQVAGHSGGPVRSYVGPKTLARILSELLKMAIDGGALPSVINIAQPNPVPMADLLMASGHDWEFGPVRSGVIPRVELSTERLTTLCFVPTATPAQLVAEASEVRAAS